MSNISKKRRVSMIDEKDFVFKQIQESINLKDFLINEIENIITISKQITNALKNGKKVLLCGNGGSAADAQHLAAEFSGRFNYDRDSLPAIALTTNSSSVTAIANDYGYETIFAKPIRGLVKKGDILIALSAGGNSPNIVLAIEEAKKKGAITIGFTGKEGGKLKDLADYIIYVPSSVTARIQETHITIGHIICGLVEEKIFGN
jgi:D-sedoheptulose 7-phosphate isomerase